MKIILNSNLLDVFLTYIINMWDAFFQILSSVVWNIYKLSEQSIKKVQKDSLSVDRSKTIGSSYPLYKRGSMTNKTNCQNNTVHTTTLSKPLMKSKCTGYVTPHKKSENVDDTCVIRLVLNKSISTMNSRTKLKSIKQRKLLWPIRLCISFLEPSHQNRDDLFIMMLLYQ